MLLQEIIAVYTDKHTEHIKQNITLLIFKAVDTYIYHSVLKILI
jgi:hypothetical protein